ncbi:TetR/AcrR family transcriptional regulator [Peribacillus saganii]|uniref:TetR/AcrR family transcriptional regulator n=1 Tax=Peribacillus saganii TaxID=2303992 RepID=UPI0026C4ED8E|nr:helix-turn-helix domain-containing protein [Peribacillus saganii]
MLKKQLIMEKALELFAEQGFETTSVQQITERCGISKGAFYLSFKSKDELILALIDNFMMQITAEIDYAVRNTKDDGIFYINFITQPLTHFISILILSKLSPRNKRNHLIRNYF